MSAKTLINFYRYTIVSILSGCISAWFGDCSAADHKAGGESHMMPHDAEKIMKDHSHPGHELFTLLPSGRHYRSIQARTTRLMGHQAS